MKNRARLLVDIDVPKLEPAIEFYRNALGLNLARVIDGDVAELTGASSTIYLLEKKVASTPAKNLDETRHYARHWTPVHVDFVVDGLLDAAERALAAGARQETGVIEWMGSRCITFSDPFGHGFCLIEFANETYGN